MNLDYIKPDEWKIIEEGFDKENITASESIFSLGNGAMGQRANFEVFPNNLATLMALSTAVQHNTLENVKCWSSDLNSHIPLSGSFQCLLTIQFVYNLRHNVDLM